MEERRAIVSSPASGIQHPTSIFSLALTDFRNYASLRIEADAGPVVLTGLNGAGKTNLLEAVSLLAPGRGLRRARMREMDRWAEGEAAGPWTIAARLGGPGGGVQIGTGRDVAAAERSDRRIVKVEGKPARSHSELAKYANVLWVTPQMDTLFQESGSVRRRFLDRLVYSFEPDHAARVNAYEQAMQERNRLLKIQPSDSTWISALEARMAAQGMAIAQARTNTVETINDSIMMASAAFPRARLSLCGWVDEQLAVHGAALAAEEAFAGALAESRREDMAAGRALIGPHRTDLRVEHMVRAVAANACSTGEQKALLLSIVLAQARSVAAWRGSVPVLLLDEVAAHLDEARRAALFEEILSLGAQAWLTGTDEGLFEGLEGKAQFFAVADGSINKVSYAAKSG